MVGSPNWEIARPILSQKMEAVGQLIGGVGSRLHQYSDHHSIGDRSAPPTKHRRHR